MSSPTYRHLKGMNRWVVFSLNPRKESEIEEELLNNPEDICMSYICTKSKLSCEFIEKLLVLSTGLLRTDNIEKDFNAVKDVIEHKYTRKDKKKVISRTITDKEGNPLEITTNTVNDRVDWLAISMHQELTEEFIDKYMNALDKKVLASKTNYSKSILDKVEAALKEESAARTPVKTTVKDKDKEAVKKLMKKFGVES